MHVSYDDIIHRIPENPKWWLWGVPRYSQFNPHDASIYGSQVVLVRTRCQMCPAVFEIAEFPSHIDLRDQLALYGDLFVGDPPRHGDCGGNTMQSESIEILEFWVNEMPFKWRRLCQFEVLLPGAEEYSGDLQAIIWRIDEAGFTDEFRNAFAHKNEAALGKILADVGVADPKYMARLLFAVDRRNQLLLLANQQTAFSHRKEVETPVEVPRRQKFSWLWSLAAKF